MPEPSQPATVDDDYEIEHSPLEREITRDGSTVEIYIYRGPDNSSRWLLEVEDESGGSTVWDSQFDTDQQALDAALKAIDEDGIESFAEASSSHEAHRQAWALECDTSPLADIRRTLDGSPGMMAFHQVIGLFAAVATAPTLVRPRTWLERVQGKHVFKSTDEAQGFSQGVMALYNEVLRSVAEREAHCCPHPDDLDAVRQFCQGYLAIAAEDTTWEADPRAFAELLPLSALAGFSSTNAVAELLPSVREDPEAWLRSAHQELPVTVIALYEYWAEARRLAVDAMASASAPFRRTSPKVGRNDPCPCGSGKKYKRCCRN